MHRNKFSKSAGLIVVTSDNEVALIRRMVPYCYEDYFYKAKLRPITREKLALYIEKFKTEVLPKLTDQQQEDFVNFYERNGKCEDLFDFPHGQIKNSKKITRNNMYSYKKHLFNTAFQEFREETGYTFDVDEHDIENKKIFLIEFEAPDGFTYTQFYFKFTNVKLKYCGGKEPHYITHLLPLKEARNILRKQQNVKRDYKHLLI
jgi:hypothetical protein